MVQQLCNAVSIPNKGEKTFTLKWKFGTEFLATYVTTE